MKKGITIIMLVLSTFVLSQQFVITKDNYKTKNDLTKNDLTKDYVVLDFPGIKKDDLFTMAKKYIVANYKGLKNDGYNEVQNEQIVLDVISQSSLKIWINLQGSNLWKLSNRYEINFKDEKLMIRPSFNHFSNTANNSTANYTVMFNSRGEISKDKAAWFVESITNNWIRDFKSEMPLNKSDNW